jgi:hypothetical protein
LPPQRDLKIPHFIRKSMNLKYVLNQRFVFDIDIIAE